MATTPEPRPVVLLSGLSTIAGAELAKLLEGAGYEVVEAGSSDAAVSGLAVSVGPATAPSSTATRFEAQDRAELARHDLLTPLAVISGMAETLELSWERLADPDRRRLVTSIKNQAARAATIAETAFGG